MNQRNLLAAIFAIALFALSVSAGNDTRFIARLSGAGKGKAAYKVKQDNRATSSELQIEAENLARNTNFTVIIGANAWQARTDAFGNFEIRERWVGSPLSISSGTPVVVQFESTGNQVLSGTFSQL